MTHPLLYEINTRCWLRALSESANKSITLGGAPDSEFAWWQELGFTHIWLMGVWTTGPRSRAQALQDERLKKAFDEVLPGWREEDVPGSPYAIGDYQVPAALGGEDGLKDFRRRLNERGMKLVLDFVPNHLGLDHPWATQKPALFVQSPTSVAGTFCQNTALGIRWLAHGKDPYFAPWTDTLQLDYRRPETRATMTELLQSVAARCDGVRCDMAMLLLNDVFAKTWAHFLIPDAAPESEFWADAIAAVKKTAPEFLFLAEVYWGLQPRLQALGFDYTYDKCVYDFIVDRKLNDLRAHLREIPVEGMARDAHFLENHDERRVAAVLSLAEHRAAALATLALPGLRLLHDGQLIGARTHIPVQLARAPREPVNAEIAGLYRELFGALKNSAVGRAEGKLLVPEMAWAGNPTAENFVVAQWQASPTEFDLIVVNLAPYRSQCRVRLDIRGLAGVDWELSDRLSPERHPRHGRELNDIGLFLDLPGLGVNFFRCHAARG